MLKEIISILDHRNNILEYVHSPSTCIAVKEWYKICFTDTFRICMHFSPGGGYGHFPVIDSEADPRSELNVSTL